ncbi:hypothetical protein D3C71_2118690 [compost metagenome]
MEVLRIKDIKKLRNIGNNKAYEFMHKLPYIFDGALGVYKQDYEEYCEKERQKAKEDLEVRQQNLDKTPKTSEYFIRKLN